jgi:hypothetical protein
VDPRQLFQLMKPLERSQCVGFGRRHRRAALLALPVLAVLAGGGCGPSPSAVVERNAKAFDSAPAPLKAEWTGALAAAKTNGYCAAILTLQAIRQAPGLTAEQTTALDQTDSAIREQMTAAAQKGDPAAVKAIDELRKAFLESRGRGR